MMILAVVLLLVVVGVIAWFASQRQKTTRLKKRFGSEYGRAVSEFGGRTKAETELAKREERVARLRLVPLSPADASRFSQAWKVLQGRFVDNPKGVVTDADRLVRELMTIRGYPMGDFDQRAADISVDHPAVVTNYRAAQAIAERDARGQATPKSCGRPWCTTAPCLMIFLRFRLRPAPEPSAP
jgi:hypothetical protein